MPITTAPALLVGLGARILLNAISRGPHAESSIRESILFGVWQGVGLQYAGKHSQVVIFVGVAIAIKLFYDFAVSPDPNRCLPTIIGVLLGVVGTELLSSYVDQLFVSGGGSADAVEPRKRTRSFGTAGANTGHRRITVHVQAPRKQPHDRTVQFRPSVHGGSVETEANQHQHALSQAPPTLASDITSVESTFELIGHKPSATPVEREIAALRARASLADSERRRYREERKWAFSAGDLARAEQMKSEYKRYKALMESCHREADLKLLALEASKGRGPRRENRELFDFPREYPLQKQPPFHARGGDPANGHSSQSSPSYQEYRATHQRRISASRRDPNR